ncbi:NAD(P)H:quinone oxidoreductase [Frankia canadensis]|uniref:NAD(P)H:quinone oxidoreductase n=1 Tax=Frankia canadensis TaxID=1836972 RepID=A0A2I2KM08_9ACTN|nr:NmrA family NAD(P)-binding protein [Frankia canadensis]SNQ46701.1 NAD(P)H:quinone oxidoreductase [Frankia canadensis]SOU53991.1 NAD(P)H:quinone oxidoreductase [Frankia canadensis]
MGSIAVTGITGHLAPLVIDGLLGAGVAQSSLVGLARAPERAASLAARGVDVRLGDYDAPETLTAALAGVSTLLLVSASEVGKRIVQHTNVVEAAKAAGVARIAYTSIVRADTSAVSLAVEHKATEQVIAASGLPYTFLRNSWYIENYTRDLARHLATGVIVGAAGGGKIAGATIADYAAAAVAVLTGDGHEGTTYELGGTPFTLAELAAAITDVTGTNVTYQDLPEAEFIATLREHAGLDEGTAAFVAGLDAAIARGELDVPTTDLETLIGRPSTPLADVIRAARS